MIKNIIFDIGGVLIDFHWKRTMREHGFSEEAVACLGENMVLSENWNKLDMGAIAEEKIFEEFCTTLPEYRDEIYRFLEFKEEIVTPFPGSRQWIYQLKRRGFHIYLLSNYPRSFFEIHSEKRFDFMDLVDGAVISYEIQCTKPDEGIYKSLLGKYSLRPEECVFIDDRRPNVLTARAMGMQGIHFISQSQAMEELEDVFALCFTKEGQSLVYDGRVMSLWKDRLQMPDGNMVEYDLVKQKGGASVLPVDEEGNVYLVKQYRNTLNRIQLELPAGCYDFAGEDKLACAKRELKEELGMTAGTWTYFTEIITDIGISDERVAIFFATGLSRGQGHPDPEEFIKMVKLPYREALELVYAGEIVDAKTVAAILGYQKYL